MNTKKGIKNIGYAFLSQIVALVLGIFIPRLTIVSYGSEMNGLLSSIATVMTYLTLLEAGVGAATCQALYKPIAQKNKTGINGVLSATHYYYKRTGIAYFGLVLGLAFIYPFVVRQSYNYWVVWFLVFVNGIPGVINFFFQRKYITLLDAEGESYIVTNLRTVISTVLSFVKIVLLSLHINIILIQIIYCMSSLIQMLYIHYYVKKRYPWISVNETPDTKALGQKNAALVHQVCAMITNSTDVMILSILGNLAMVSIYSVYNMLFNIIYNAIYSINTGVAFILGQSYCQGKESYCKKIDAYETVYITMTAWLLGVTYVMITPFMKLYTSGADINYVDNIFPILFLVVKFFEAVRNASANTITVSGNFEGSKKHAIIESILNLSISILSVWKFGMVGVLFGTIVALVYRSIVSTYYANVVILERKCTHSIKVVVLNSILLLMAILLGQHMSLNFSNYVQCVFIAGIYTCVFGVAFVGINLLVDYKSIKIVVAYVKSKIRNR